MFQNPVCGGSGHSIRGKPIDYRTFVLILFLPGRFGNQLAPKPGIPQRHLLWPPVLFWEISGVPTDIRIPTLAP
jgi:hypothetical protein